MPDETVTRATEEPTTRELIESIYTRESSDEHVVIAHGFGIQVKIQYGQLVIKDGIGSSRRERKYPAADRTIKRLVIASPDGYVTLDALQWCAQHGISVLTLNPDCEVTGHYATSDRIIDGRLLRRQVSASSDGTDTEIARMLLARKITGQADNLLKYLDDYNISARLYKYADDIQSATEMSELNDLEKFAARDYFESWVNRGVHVPFDERSIARIPGNWMMFQRRKMGATKENTKRHATEPVSAMLNYAYALGASEARTACVAYGLNPLLGFIHADRLGRDSLVYDVLETMRPEIDACILGLLGYGQQARQFTYRDFHQPRDFPPGTVRLVAPLTHEIAESSYSWHRTAVEACKAILNMLSGSAGRVGVKSLSLATQKAEFVSRDVDLSTVLPDEWWDRFTAVIPATARMDYSSISNRTVIAAMVYLRRHHKPLAYVPPSMGVSRRTLHERRLRWSRAGLWPEIDALIDELAYGVR